MTLVDELKKTIRDVPDFPKPGIVFKDIGPLLRDPVLLDKCITDLAAKAKELKVQHIVGIESRGFMFAVPLALKMGLPFVPARKKGKLPGKVVSESYQLEYGVDHIEIQQDSIVPGDRYLIVDDVIATGGTAKTVARLIQNNRGQVAGFSFVIGLSFLDGDKHLKAEAPEAKIHTVYTV